MSMDKECMLFGLNTLISNHVKKSKKKFTLVVYSLQVGFNMYPIYTLYLQLLAHGPPKC